MIDDNSTGIATFFSFLYSPGATKDQIGLQEVSRHYRQLRYGRLSDADTQSPEYQQVLKELKRSVSQLL